MKTAIAAVLIAGSLVGAQARGPETWEYGRLYVVSNMGTMLWSTVDSSFVIDSGSLQHGAPAAAPRSLPLLRAMSRLGREGWELVAPSPEGLDRTYLFKRRRP